MPYLTPETLPTEDQCRRLLIPSSPEWLAIVSGALTELTLTWNWQQKGITVSEALDAAQAIVESYYDQPCTDPDACTTEEGTRVIRLVPGGAWQELINGTWQTPTGDLEIEPTPARTEPTEADRLCLAAKNSVNSLKLTYEEVTDLFDEFGAIEPVVAGMLVFIGAVVAAFVSVAAAAFVALGGFAIEKFFQALGTISYDLWNADFEEFLYCTFLEHATDDSGVVSFDYDAIVKDINDEIAGVNLDFQRKQLATQVLYLLSIIGAPGIDWAGTTTAISDDDCSDCTDEWCAFFDFTVDNGGWSVNSGLGTYSSGIGWQTTYVDFGSAAYRAMTIQKNLSAATTITQFIAVYDVTWGGLQGTPADARNITLRLNALSSNIDPVRQFYPNLNDELAFNGVLNSVEQLHFLATSGYDSTSPRTDQGGQITLKSILVRGEGTYPFTGYECP